MIGLFVIYIIHPHVLRLEDVVTVAYDNSWFYVTQPIVLLKETEE